MTDIKAFLWRGALAGAVGGLLAALYQWSITEDQIRQALAIEEARSARNDELFSRSEQVVGGMLATGLYGLFLGVVFAIGCAGLWVALPGRGAFGRAIRLASVAYGAWFLVPNLKYPANPPAVGDPDTVDDRTRWYLALIALSLILAVGAWQLWRHLTARGVDGAPRFAAVAGGYAVAVGLVYVIMPSSPDAVEVPANLIWHFRLAVFAQNALLWIVMGTVFGWLADRALATEAQRTEAAPA
jgi:predicted cobalt transporter CbtA